MVNPIINPNTASAANFNKIGVTDCGAQLVRDRPDAWKAFLETAHSIIERMPGDDVPSHLGFGAFAGVYELPEYSDLCVKVVTPQTIRSERFGDFANVRMPNLFVDLGFMNRVHKVLAQRPDQGVSSPRHYGAVRAQGRAPGYAMLQERLPSNVTSVGNYLKGQGVKIEIDDPQYAKMSSIFCHRFGRALGRSVLKFGVNDFAYDSPGHDTKVLHNKNIWFDPGVAMEETPLHVIDLISCGIIRRRAAALLST